MTQKKGFGVCFLSCAIGCGTVMWSEMKGIVWLIPITVLVSKSTITVAFCFIYFTTVDYFESSYLGFAIGLVNVFGRGSTIFSPIVAEIAEPVPMATCIVLCLAAFIMSLYLEQP